MSVSCCFSLALRCSKFLLMYSQGLDFVAIVKKLAKLLRQNRYFSNIVPIASAKVPIVKLKHRKTGLESDISLYNTLGRRNSQLLATYSAIDPRVRVHFVTEEIFVEL